MDGPPHILIVDDHREIRDLVSRVLAREGFRVSVAVDGSAMREVLAGARIELILLDLMLPGEDGLSLCRGLRAESDVPIIMLTAKGDEIDRVIGLEIGGDDYVTKPFSPREMVARVNVILRRATPLPAPVQEEAPLSHGVLTLRPMLHAAELDGTPLDLTAVEFAILKVLLARAGAVLSRDQIMTAAYGGNINVSDRTIDSHVRNIRAKLARAGCDNAIETVHAVGFRLGRCTASA